MNHWLGRDQGRVARVNAELGKLDADVAERIAAAGDAVGNGEHDDHSPIDVFQTGSGTSSNMNANEVMANLAGDGAHIPTTTSTWASRRTTSFPSAVHLAALTRSRNDLLPALEAWRPRSRPRRTSSHDHVKSGRTT